MKVKFLPRYAAGAFALAAFFACQTEPSVESQAEMVLVEDGISVPASKLQPGHVRVYVTEEFLQSVADRMDEKHDASAMLMDNVHEALPSISPLKMERTFPYAGRFEARSVAAGLDHWYDLYFESELQISEYSEIISSLPEVEFCEYCPKVEAYFTEEAEDLDMSQNASSSDYPFNDPQLSKQWHYYNDGSKSTTMQGSDINVFPVWQAVEVGNSDVIVAVVDGGVDASHEDLHDNMWVDPDFREFPAYGFNFTNSTHKNIPNNHGTHVAGTISAVNNNGIGVAGIAGGNYAEGIPGVRIMSCQIFDEEGKGSGAGSTAIKWACDHGAVIAQNSWGYTTATYLPSSDRAAIDYFNTYAGLDEHGNQVGPIAGGIVIFAAGNESRDWSYPAKYEGTLAVGAIGADYQPAYYTNYGDWVDIAAPGGDAKKGYQVLSTLPGNKYGSMQGTSMACPHVSGVAALVISHFGGPGFTRTMLWNRLVNTETELYPLSGNSKPIGNLVNALAATSNFGTIAPDPVTEFSASPLNSNFVSISVTVPADEDDEKAFGVNVYYSNTPFESTASIPYKSFNLGGLAAGSQYQGVLSGLSFSTEYYLRAEAYDLSGNRSGLSDLVTVRTSDNSAPKIEITSASLKLDVRAHETKYITFSYSDADGHEMSPFLESQSEADTLLIAGIHKAQITIRGNMADPGKYVSTVTVLDEFDAFDSFSFEYTIYANKGPEKVADIPDMLFNKSGDVKEYKLSDYITDPDGEVLSINTVMSDESVASVSVAAGKLYVTSLKAGSTTATITATDASGEMTSQDFNIVVRNGDTPFDLYPNPVTTNLFIRTGEELASTQIQVFTQTGKKVKDVTVDASVFEPASVDMSDCAPGVYSVVVRFGGKEYKKTIAKI